MSKERAVAIIAELIHDLDVSIGSHQRVWADNKKSGSNKGNKFYYTPKRDKVSWREKLSNLLVELTGNDR